MIKLLVTTLMALIGFTVMAQDLDKRSERAITYLENKKTTLEENERDLLKEKLLVIAERLEDGEITAAQSEALKKEAAELHAANIANGKAALDQEIAFVRANGSDHMDVPYSIKIGSAEVRDRDDDNNHLFHNSQLVFAMGNQFIIEDGDFAGYSTGWNLGSTELGITWELGLDRGRHFNFRYGTSVLWQKLIFNGDNFFVDQGDVTTVEQFSVELDKAKFRQTSLIAPLFLEYSAHRNGNRWDKGFKLGAGGFVGVTMNTVQKLKYEDGGQDIKTKVNANYNTENLLYGLNAYIGVDDFSVFGRLHLNELFRDNPVEQQVINFGIRWDWY